MHPLTHSNTLRIFHRPGRDLHRDDAPVQIRPLPHGKMDFRSLPKVELHLHLDCSLSYKVASTIHPSLTRDQYNREFIAPVKCVDLADFLTRARKGIELMQTREQLRLVTDDLFQQLKRDNVVYAEIRFAPLLHMEQGLTPEEIVETVANAAYTACRETKIRALLILCTLRHFTAEQSMQTVRLAERFRTDMIGGFDIAGDESGFPLDPHVPAFSYGAEKKIPRTAHAGEALGSTSVRETLHRLRPSRIGHGVRSIGDRNLVAGLRKDGIHLEICPSCNVQINIFDTLAEHPIDQLYDSGVSLSVNTDARTITNVTLSDEYERLHRTFGWEEEDFLTCSLNAIQASFADESVKHEVYDQLHAAYREG